MKTVYFDNAATTEICEQAKQAAANALAELWHNPSSLYSEGMKAEQLLDSSRAVIARSIGASASEIVFTSCGTESNNLAVLGLARARAKWGKRVVATAYEHPSVANAVAALKDEGFEVVLIPPRNGIIDIDEFANAVTPDTALCTAMGVNNETGAVIDVAALAAAAKSRAKRCAFHCDWVQGYMKLPIDMKCNLIDTLSISGHKIHAPKGVAALYVRKGLNISNLMFGGEQERRLRPGTENVAFAAAFAAAVAAYERKPLFEIKERLVRGLSQISEVIINSPTDSSDAILNFSLVGYKSEPVLHFLESRGILISSGSACSKGARSHTLEAMSLPREVVDSSIRVSLDGKNTAEQADYFIECIKEARDTLAHR